MRAAVRMVCLAASLLAAAWHGPAAGGTEEVYREFVGPNGAYRVIVLRRPLPFAMPGQGSDAPGLVRLLDGDGHVLREMQLEMVQLVDRVEWSHHRVHIPLIADWPLPDRPDSRH